MASAQQMPPIMLGLRVDTGSTEQLRPKQAQMDNRWQQQPPQKPPRKFHYQSVQVRVGRCENDIDWIKIYT
jgi:hypothetical protein